MMIVVTIAEFAQSYMAQARNSGRSSPSLASQPLRLGTGGHVSSGASSELDMISIHDQNRGCMARSYW